MIAKTKSKFFDGTKRIRELEIINKDLQKDQDFLASLYQTSLTCQTTNKISTIFRIIGRELQKSGLGATVFFLDKKKENLVIRYTTLKYHTPAKLLKELAGCRIIGLRLPLEKIDYYQKIINSGRGHLFGGRSQRRLLEKFFSTTPQLLEENGQILKKPVRTFIDRAIKERVKTISIPMGSNGEKIGLFEVYASNLSESDLPALTIFAHQVSNTLRNLKSSREILLLNKRLEERVRRRTEDFLNILHSKSQFIANASHELRTPLSVIQANWDLFNLLLYKNHQQVPSELNETGETIKEQIGNLAHLIDDLLLLAREDSGVYQFKKAKFDFANLIKYIIGKMEILAGKRKIKINPEIPGTFKLYGDQKMLRKMIENLIYNAIKYGRRKGQIDINLRRCSKYQAKFAVSDDGPGIAPEHLPHIFEHFYRGSKARSKLAGGSGLGLTICRWIVEAHQGKIRVDSKLGEGSKFSVYLPIIPEKERNRKNNTD